MFIISSTRRSALAAVVALFTTATASADTCEEVVKAAAKAIAAECKRHNYDTLALGVIEPPTGKPTVTTGPGILQQLTEALKNEKIQIGDMAHVGVSGKLSYISDILWLRLQLKDEAEKALVNFERAITNKEDVVEIIGVTVSIRPGAKPAERAAAIARAIEKPPEPNIKQGTRIASPDGKYSFEVRVDGVPREVSKKSDSAFAYVEFKRAENYTIRLYNDSDIDCAAKVTIDGLSVFEFAQDSSKPNVWIIDKGKNNITDIRGWYANSRESHKFLVGVFDKEAHKYLKQGSIATISASFFAYFEPKATIPDEELRIEGAGDLPVTVKGHIQKDPTILIEGGTIGKLRGAASVRYRLPQQ